MKDSLLGIDTNQGFNSAAVDNIFIVTHQEGDPWREDPKHPERNLRITVSHLGSDAAVGATLPEETTTAFTHERLPDDNSGIIRDTFVVRTTGFTVYRPGYLGYVNFPMLKDQVWYSVNGAYPPYHPKGVFTPDHHPYQQRVRRTSDAIRYNPMKAVYYEFGQSGDGEGYLNLQNLPSTVPHGDIYSPVFGPDARRFPFLYVEFARLSRDEEGNETFIPITNAMYEELEVLPEFWGHVLVMDASKSRAHIAADLNYQLKKIHPNLRVELGQYETLSMVTFNFVLPYDIVLSRTRLTRGDDEINQGNEVRPVKSDDWCMNTQQGRLTRWLGTDGWSDDYTDGVYHFPNIPDVMGLAPHDAVATTVSWLAEDVNEEGEFTTDIQIPAEAYTYNWKHWTEVAARIGVQAPPGYVVLKRAEWVETIDDQEVIHPAYLFRREYVDPTAGEDEYGEMLNGSAFVSEWEIEPEYMEIAKGRTPATSPVLFGEEQTAWLHVAPPPQTDGSDTSNISPYGVYRPRSGTLRLVFGNYVPQTGAAMVKIEGEVRQQLEQRMDQVTPPFMSPIHEDTTGFNVQVIPHTPEEEGSVDQVLIETNFLHSWMDFSLAAGFLIRRDDAEPIIRIINLAWDDPDNYEIEAWYETSEGEHFSGDIPIETLRESIQPDGSILIPMEFWDVANATYHTVSKVIYINTYGIQDADYLSHEFRYTVQTTSPLLPESEDAYQAMPIITGPLVYSNVTGGSTEPVQMELFLPEEGFLTGSVLLDENFQENFTEAMQGYLIEAEFDAVADTLTFNRIGGGLMLVAFTTMSGEPVSPIVVDERLADHTYRGAYPVWEDYSAGVAGEHHKTLSVFLADPETDIVPPPVEPVFTVVEIPTAIREEISSDGTMLRPDQLTGYTVTIDNEPEDGDVDAFIDITRPLVQEWMSIEAAQLRKPTWWVASPVPSPYQLAIRTTDPRFIDWYNNAPIDDGGAFIGLHLSYSDDVPDSPRYGFADPHSISPRDCRLVMENDEEVLYLPFSPTSTARLGRDVMTIVDIHIPSYDGVQHYAPIRFRVKSNIADVDQLIPVTQDNANVILSVPEILTATTALGSTEAFSRIHDNISYGYYENLSSTTSFSIATKLDGITSWVTEYNRVTVDWSNNELALDTGFANDHDALIQVFFVDATLPAVDTSGTPFHFTQVEGGVVMSVLFPQLTLPEVSVEPTEFSVKKSEDGNSIIRRFATDLAQFNGEFTTDDRMEVQVQYGQPDSAGWYPGAYGTRFYIGTSNESSDIIYDWQPADFRNAPPGADIRPARVQAVKSVPWTKRYTIYKELN